MLQAAFDESEKNGVFVLAGFYAEPEQWRKFNSDWERTLRRFGRLNKDGIWQTKMEVMKSDEAKASIPIFFDCIDRHVKGSIAVIVHRDDIQRAIRRLVVPGVKFEWGYHSNPYYITFMQLMSALYTDKRRNQLDHVVRESKVGGITKEDEIQLYFDERPEQKKLLSWWPEYVENLGDADKAYVGDPPVFLKDDDFPPLQAADLWAWWISDGYEPGHHLEITHKVHLNVPWPGTKSYDTNSNRLTIIYTEDDLVKTFKRLIREHPSNPQFIFDLKPIQNAYTDVQRYLYNVLGLK